MFLVQTFVHSGLLIAVVRPFVSMYRELPRGQRVYFRITDYWCAMLGLVPSFLALAFAVDRSNANYPYAREYALWVYMIATGQLAGLFMGRVHNQVPDRVTRATAWTEAGWMIAGADIGLLLPFVSLTITLIGGVILMAMLPIAPLLIAVVTFLIWWYRRR